MNLKNLFALVLSLTICSLHAQIPDGSISPNFTAKDINGVEYDLYSILAEGKSVVIDFSTTWCGPCWSYHQTGNLHDYMSEFGPEGTDESIVFFVEADPTTGIDELNGTSGSTIGDWVTGTNYPILDHSYIANMYGVTSYPTIVMICPDRILTEIGQATKDNIINISKNCSSIETKPKVDFFAQDFSGCNQLEVQFYDNTWPKPDTYLWNFGDGNTSNDKNPEHQYEEPGDYTVSLVANNSFGEATEEKVDFIKVGSGDSNPIENIGPVDNTIGSGDMFPGGHHGLIFNTEKDVIISSVKVYSDREQERVIVLLDKNGALLQSRKVIIPEGEHRIDINIFVLQGNDYELGLFSEAHLFRNSDGAVYPFIIDDLISITKNTASSTAVNYYYYFYDWEVREAGCTGVVNNEDYELEYFKVFPNPTFDLITIESDSNIKPIMYNTIGQQLNLPTTAGTKSWIIDMSSVQNGMYYIQVGKSIQSINKM